MLHRKMVLNSIQTVLTKMGDLIKFSPSVRKKGKKSNQIVLNPHFSFLTFRGGKGEENTENARTPNSTPSSTALQCPTSPSSVSPSLSLSVTPSRCPGDWREREELGKRLSHNTHPSVVLGREHSTKKKPERINSVYFNVPSYSY
jgi:hypothetical protein